MTVSISHKLIYFFYALWFYRALSLEVTLIQLIQCPAISSIQQAVTRNSIAPNGIGYLGRPTSGISFCAFKNLGTWTTRANGRHLWSVIQVTSASPLLYIQTSARLSLLLNYNIVKHQSSYDFSLVCAEYMDDSYTYAFDRLMHIGVEPR